MEHASLLPLGVLLLVACVVAMVTRKIRLPYSVGLVSAGILLSLLPFGGELTLNPNLIFEVFLPPLVFEAALQLRWSALKRELPVILSLAFFGVLIAAAIVTMALRQFLGWSWIGAAFFGILIAATDPVSVIAAFKEMRVEPRLSLLVEGESLFNDGVAAVGFALLLGVAEGSGLSPSTVLFSLGWTALGGIAVGCGVAYAVLLLAGRTDDHLVEITLTVIAAYGSFLLAERLRMSGVLASLSAGLVVGNVGWVGSISPNGREHTLSFWEFAAFLANSLIFILIGTHEAHQPIHRFAGIVLIAVLFTLIGRVVAIYPLCAVFGWCGRPVDRRYQHVLFWGGLRGALALALALALPANVPERREIIVAAFAVVAFSIFVQALSIPLLLKRLNVFQREEQPFEADPLPGG